MCLGFFKKRKSEVLLNFEDSNMNLFSSNSEIMTYIPLTKGDSKKLNVTEF